MGSISALIYTAELILCFTIRRNFSCVFKFLCFQKVSFSWKISVDGRPNRRNKSAFSNSRSSVVQTGADCHTNESSLRLPETENAVWKHRFQGRLTQEGHGYRSLPKSLTSPSTFDTTLWCSCSLFLIGLQRTKNYLRVFSDDWPKKCLLTPPRKLLQTDLAN